MFCSSQTARTSRSSKKLKIKKKKEITEEESVEEDVTEVVEESLVEVLDTEVGYLNVRSEASVDGEILTTVNPVEQYEFTEQENGWYLILLEDGTEGWVSGDYLNEVE